MIDQLASVPFSALLDILVVSFVIYNVLLFVRGTRALPMLAGLFMLLIVYWLSAEFSLVALNWILGNFLGSVILVIVVLFQDDLRRGLVKVGLVPGLGGGVGAGVQSDTIKSISKAAAELASRRVGALIVIARDVGVDEYAEHAVPIKAEVTHQLLISIFNTDSPIHDGAVLISDDKILAAGAVLPLTFNPSVGQDMGTRHRAALGLSEKSDALMVVVSEETGAISLVREGKFIRGLNEKSLNSTLSGILQLGSSGSGGFSLRRLFASG